MIKDDIDKLLPEAIKSKDAVRTRVLRVIKSELSKVEALDRSVYNTMTEFKILMKLKSQYQESIQQYTTVNNTEAAEEETKELNILNEFLPKEASTEEVTKYVEDFIKTLGYKPSMRDMKLILAQVQFKYPTVTGQLVSSILKKIINV